MAWNDPYGAGLGPAGYSPLETPSEYVRPALPLAMRFDGASGDWLLDDNGEYVLDHPADQGVALALCIRRGAIKTARAVGNTLHKITNLSSKTLPGAVENAVRTAVPLASYLADGSVVIRKIDHEVRPHGGLAVRVYYVNVALGRDGVFPPL